MLSCLRYGKTILRDGSLAQVQPIREFDGYKRLDGISVPWPDGTPAQRSGHSNTTCWLPTDVEVDLNDKAVELKSYINNVHPIYQSGLHEALKTLLTRFIPMFEKLLGDLRNHTTGTLFEGDWSCLDEDKRPINPDTGKPITERDGDEDEDWDHNPAWVAWLETQPYIDPKPDEYECRTRMLGTGYSLKGKTVQIIVKVAEM